jgi:hypothetical protein
LHFVASLFLQERELGLALDTFRDHFEIERAAEP